MFSFFFLGDTAPGAQLLFWPLPLHVRHPQARAPHTGTREQSKASLGHIDFFSPGSGVQQAQLGCVRIASAIRN